MGRTAGNYAYEERTFAKLGVKFKFYHNWLRPSILRIKGEKCEECSSNKDLQLHHSDMGLINIDTLKVLCRPCHREKHKKVNEYES